MQLLKRIYFNFKVLIQIKIYVNLRYTIDRQKYILWSSFWFNLLSFKTKNFQMHHKNDIIAVIYIFFFILSSLCYHCLFQIDCLNRGISNSIGVGENFAQSLIFVSKGMYVAKSMCGRDQLFSWNSSTELPCRTKCFKIT